MEDFSYFSCKTTNKWKYIITYWNLLSFSQFLLLHDDDDVHFVFFGLQCELNFLVGLFLFGVFMYEDIVSVCGCSCFKSSQ